MLIVDFWSVNMLTGTATSMAKKKVMSVSADCKEVEKDFVEIKQKKDTTPTVPRGSPILVLSWPDWA